MVVKKKCKKCGLYMVTSLSNTNPICEDCAEEEIEEDVGESGKRDTN